MTYQEILDIVATKLDIPQERVEKIYRSFWRAIRENIQELPLKDIDSREDFEKLRVNFNIPSLGKLCCTADKFSGMKKKVQFMKNLHKKYEAQKD